MNPVAGIINRVKNRVQVYDYFIYLTNLPLFFTPGLIYLHLKIPAPSEKDNSRFLKFVDNRYLCGPLNIGVRIAEAVSAASVYKY